MTTTTRPLVLTVTQAGLLLGVSRSTAYELVRSGELESVKLRRRVVVPVNAIADRLKVPLDVVYAALRTASTDFRSYSSNQSSSSSYTDVRAQPTDVSCE